MKTYRIAILGCRARGAAAARAYHAHPRTQIVGLCDLVPERLAQLGAELGVDAHFTDLDQMIEQSRPDIVAIPTATEFHYDLCMRVLEHGVNLEVEKPLCTTLAEADAILAKAQAKGLRTAVHHQARAGVSIQTVAHALRQGRIGQPHYLTASGKGYYGGYGLMNIGTHLLNSIVEFTGPCRRVSALALVNGRPATPADVILAPSGMGPIIGEHITATLQFDGNLTATLRQHRLPTIDSLAMSIEILGATGRLLHNHQRGPWWLPVASYVPGDERSSWQPLELVIPAPYAQRRNQAAFQSPLESAADDYGFVNEYVAALDEGREHVCSGIQGRHVMEIMMGIFESAAYGRPVELPQAQRDHPLLRWRQEAGLPPPGTTPRDYLEWLQAEDQRLGR